MDHETRAETLRPPLLMSEDDHARLVALAGAAARRDPLVARLLMEEADRAEVVPAEAVPSGVVALGSRVEFHDSATGRVRTVQVVLPGEADIAAGRISALSLVGAALLGLAEGQSIDWPTQDGRMRRLTVRRVERGGGAAPADAARPGT
ncbi:nucleoside diphosphate kinase regulator [Caldovatus sediminis]|uniref:Nucleoside diphosphate kinase regulator n=1 Tax=Caldovatus sediminis TaxID=2041189 RepID=A0A8J3EBQ3_9PROT|nr:nucleoside diphosphate kinase regulator [Caldovatus sediminis]GGG15867.1 nucleoside diphosphate kinase regulator [Caldovatus sediminis]